MSEKIYTRGQYIIEIDRRDNCPGYLYTILETNSFSIFIILLVVSFVTMLLAIAKIISPDICIILFIISFFYTIFISGALTSWLYENGRPGIIFRIINNNGMIKEIRYYQFTNDNLIDEKNMNELLNCMKLVVNKADEEYENNCIRDKIVAEERLNINNKLKYQYDNKRDLLKR